MELETWIHLSSRSEWMLRAFFHLLWPFWPPGLFHYAHQERYVSIETEIEDIFLPLCPPAAPAEVTSLKFWSYSLCSFAASLCRRPPSSSRCFVCAWRFEVFSGLMAMIMFVMMRTPMIMAMTMMMVGMMIVLKLVVVGVVQIWSLIRPEGRGCENDHGVHPKPNFFTKKAKAIYNFAEQMQLHH